MVQTNLLGRKFTSNIEKTKYTVVAVYVNSGTLYLLGENDRGVLIVFNSSTVSLIPATAEESLRGVI